MIRPIAIRILFLLAGAGSMAAILWVNSPAEDRGSEVSPIAGDPKASTHQAALEQLAVPVRTDAPTIASSPAQKLLDLTLPVLRACEGQERTARAMLLLAELRRAGPDGIAAVSAFLATQEDLPFGPRFKIGGASVLGQPSLRAAVLAELGNSKDTVARQVYRDETLNSLREALTLADAERDIQRLEYLEPGAYRAEAINAVKRLAQTEADDGKLTSVNVVSKVIAQFGAPELLPDLEAMALKEPKWRLPELFGALWGVPMELRTETTERILTDESLRSAMSSGYPLQKLDYRIPMARDFALEWFGSSAAVTLKAEAVERLASLQGWGANNLSNPAGVKPDAGSPGTPAQAQARLALLEQIAPLCPEPLVQQKLAAAQKALLQQTQGSSK